MTPQELESFRKWAEEYALVGFVQARQAVQLLAEYDRIAEAMTRSTCLYCQADLGPNDRKTAETVVAHVRVCEGHPMKAVLEENERLKAELAAAG